MASIAVTFRLVLPYPAIERRHIAAEGHLLLFGWVRRFDWPKARLLVLYIFVGRGVVGTFHKRSHKYMPLYFPSFGKAKTSPLRFPPNLQLALLQGFAVLRHVETLHFVLLADTQRNYERYRLEQKKSDNARPRKCRGDAIKLQTQLTRISLQQARRTADGCDRKHTRQKGSDRPAKAVHAE